jgi:hypothetical protein
MSGFSFLYEKIYKEASDSSPCTWSNSHDSLSSWPAINSYHTSLSHDFRPQRQTSAALVAAAAAANFSRISTHRRSSRKCMISVSQFVYTAKTVTTFLIISVTEKKKIFCHAYSLIKFLMEKITFTLVETVIKSIDHWTFLRCSWFKNRFI